MSERKNLDKLFQEKFKDFEAAVPETAWPYIKEKLKEKKKKRVIPIWWKLSGIAAALLIGFALYNGLSTHHGSHENNIVTRENTGPIPLKDKTNLKTRSTDSAVAASNPRSGKPDKETVTSGDVNATTPNNNGNRIAIIPKSDKTPLNINASRVKTPSGISAKSQIATGEGNKEHSGNARIFHHNHLSGKENQLAHNIDKSDKPSGKKAISGKARKVMNQDPLHISKSKNRNQPDAQQENANPNSKIAQQKIPDIKSGNNDKTIIPANSQQPVANNGTKTTDVVPVKKLDSTAIAAVVPNALEELLHEKENNLVTKRTRVNRWQITSSVAPIYLGSASGGSPIDSAFTGNSKSYKTNLSVKLGVNYAISKKFTVRAGISQVTWDYNTNDVFISAGFQRNPLGNVNTTDENQYLHFSRKSSLKTASAAPTPGSLSSDEFPSAINQKMGYIEVPVELSYAVIDRKFGLNVICGISTLFLNENKIVVVSDGLTTDLGEANNLRQTHFSTNVGLGMRYRFFRDFQASFEPMFKYQLDTFSKNAGNFKPYYFGLYTGLIFSF